MLISTPPIFPDRPADGHKGTFGRALIIAGSRGMSGAAALCGVSALRGGAGLVSVAVPRDIQNIVASYEPSYMTIGLPSDPESGALSADSVSQLIQITMGKDAIAIGPGLGIGPGAQAAVCKLLVSAEQPLVLDADGLNILADQQALLMSDDWSNRGARILTPHPGEFARLTQTSIVEINARRNQLAMQFAARHRCVLLLKGPSTVITDGQHIAVNSTGNSGMATGGSGDVLTGLIVALLAQGLSAFDAARTGVYWHGLAGDIAAAELSQPCLIASDLPRYFGKAWFARTTSVIDVIDRQDDHH